MKDKNLYRDFDVFARALVQSRDHDPVYPVVRDILMHYPEFEKEWFVFVYVAFYNLSTAIEFCSLWPTTASFGNTAKQKFLDMRRDGRFRHFGHERRGSCRNPVNQIQLFEAAKRFIMSSDKAGLKSMTNDEFRAHLQTFPWHGSWSAYKIAELYEKSLGWSNLEITDLGISERDPNSNDGPIGGLRWIFGREEKYNKQWFPIWNIFGEEVSKAYGWGIGETETCLCKFHKMVSGKYYVGHDIDEFHDLNHLSTYKKIMSSNFPIFYSEGIKGVKNSQKSHYMKTGEIINASYGDNISPVNIKEILLNI